jgi:small subunit ribosomal protein S20
MANTKSAKKAIRKMAKKTEVNKSRRSQMRTLIRIVEEAISAGDKAAAEEAFRDAEPIIARTGRKGVVHRNTASRKVSRLSSRIKAMGAN